MRLNFFKRSVSFLSLLALGAGLGCGSDSTSPTGSNPATQTFAPSLGVNLSSMTQLSSNLYAHDIVVGTGPVATDGHSLTVTYTGWLINGTQFDSNVGKTPFSFTLGIGQVIAGWDQGVAGMRAGGKRLLVIGSALGYANSPPLGIPASSTLVFMVQLTAVQ